MIDCIVFAPLEACKTIELADYSGGMYSGRGNGGAVFGGQD